MRLGVPGCFFGGDLGSVSGGGAGAAGGLRPTESPGSGSATGANACLPRRPRPGARVGARLAGTVPVRVGPPPGDLIGWPSRLGSESPRGRPGTPRRRSAEGDSWLLGLRPACCRPLACSALARGVRARTRALARGPPSALAPPNGHRTFWKWSPTAAPAPDRARRPRRRRRPWRPLGRGDGRGLSVGGAFGGRPLVIRRLRAGPASLAPWPRPLPPPPWRLPGSFIRRRACQTPVLSSCRPPP